MLHVANSSSTTDAGTKIFGLLENR
uniref:Uncharacterized protein n=1 Tax=Arundo donax TaxID=35708 RepID=A0A0A8Y6D4_ARUDO